MKPLGYNVPCFDLPKKLEPFVLSLSHVAHTLALNEENNLQKILQILVMFTKHDLSSYENEGVGKEISKQMLTLAFASGYMGWKEVPLLKKGLHTAFLLIFLVLLEFPSKIVES